MSRDARTMVPSWNQNSSSRVRCELRELGVASSPMASDRDSVSRLRLRDIESELSSDIVREQKLKRIKTKSVEQREEEAE